MGEPMAVGAGRGRGPLTAREGLVSNALASNWSSVGLQTRRRPCDPATAFRALNECALIVGPDIRLAELVQAKRLADHRLAFRGRAYHRSIHDVEAGIFSCEESWRTRARSVTFARPILRSERGLYGLRTDSESL